MAAHHYASHCAQFDPQRGQSPWSPGSNNCLSLPELRQLPSSPGGKNPARVLSDPVKTPCAKSPWTATTHSRSRHAKRPLQLHFLQAPHLVGPSRTPSPAGRNKVAAVSKLRRTKKVRPSSKGKQKSRPPIPLLCRVRKAFYGATSLSGSVSELLAMDNRRKVSLAKSRKLAGRKRTAAASTSSVNLKTDAPAFSQDILAHAGHPRPLGTARHSPTNLVPIPEGHNAELLASAAGFSETTPFVLSSSAHSELPHVQGDFNVIPTHLVNPMQPSSGLFFEPETRYAFIPDGDTAQLSNPDLPVAQLSQSPQTIVLNNHKPPDRYISTSHKVRPADTLVPGVPKPAGFRRPHHASRASVVSDTMEAECGISRRAGSPTVIGSGSVIDVSVEDACSRPASRTVWFALCLGVAALLSFWACYIIADMTIAARLFPTDGEVEDPMTVKPVEESKLAFSRVRRPYQYGPYVKAQNISSFQGDALVPSYSETTFIGNVTTEETVGA